MSSTLLSPEQILAATGRAYVAQALVIAVRENKPAWIPSVHVSAAVAEELRALGYTVDIDYGDNVVLVEFKR